MACYKRCKHVWEWVHAHFFLLHLPNMDVEQEASLFLLQRKCAKKFRLLQQSGCGRCGFFACWMLFRHVCWLTKPSEGWCEEFGRCMNLGSSVLIKEECNSQNFSEIRLTARSNGVVGSNISAFPWSTATNAQFHGWVVLLAAWERIVFNFRARHNCKLMITIFHIV